MFNKCSHEFETISNFYGDYINYISVNRVYRSRLRCKKCGKEKLLSCLDSKCTVINDDLCNIRRI